MTSENAPRCEWCGQTFERPHQRGPAPRFCNRGHRQRAYETRKQTKQSREVLAGIDPKMFEGITSGVLAGIDPKMFEGITSGVLAGIDPKMFEGITSGVLAGIVPKMFEGITSGVLAGIDHVFEGITSGVLAGIDPKMFEGITSGVLAGIVPKMFEGITSGVLAGIDHVFEGITSGVLAGIDPKMFDAVLDQPLLKRGQGYAFDDDDACRDLALTPDVVSAAVRLMILLVLVGLVLPALVAASSTTVIAAVQTSVLGLELVEALYAHHPAVRGALVVLAAAGGGASIYSATRDVQSRDADRE